MKCNQPSAATLGSAFLGMMGHKFLNGHNYTSVAITDHEWSSSAHCTDMQAMCDDVKQYNGEFNTMINTLWIDKDNRYYEWAFQ